MQGIFRKENTDKALKYGIYRHLPTYEKIIRNLVSFYMRKSLVCDLMEPMRPIVDYSVRKAINLEQCKKEDFEVYDNRWVLKYKMNSKYIQFLMKDILEYKDEIFVYIQKYYRFFMKMKSVEELPRFEVH